MLKASCILSPVAGLVAAVCIQAAPAVHLVNPLPQNVTTTLNARHVSLTIAVSKKIFFSGFPVLGSAVFRNQGRRTFEVSGGPVRSTFNVIRADSMSTGKSAAPTLRMIRTPRYWSSDGWLTAFVPPGRAEVYWEPIDFARYYDLTMPGKYRLQLKAGGIESNAINVTVAPPPTLQRRVALAVQVQSPVTWSAKSRPLQVILRQIKWKFGSSLEAKVFIRCSGRHPTTVRLTGDRFLDLRIAKPEGPERIDGDEIVKKPHPHWIPTPNKTSVPLTAYGRWLAKHAPKNLKWRIYTLKPGVVYEYAEPINLSCQFDMSLSGVYRSRVRLAHSRVWSPWANITVPQN